MLCVFATLGLTLSAQETATKTSCSAPCKKVAEAGCQAKSAGVAATVTPAPDRAAAVEGTAPTPALFQLTSLTAPKTNCDPTQCKPAACQPAACKPTTTETTAVALKQE